MKDRPLKESLVKHYWALRCFAQPEIDIQPPHGTAAATKLMTDVDVLILRPHPDLYFEKILGDCKTLKGQSPIARALWLKGLMSFTGSGAGVIVLNASIKIEHDHRIVSNQIGIRLQNEDEFRTYDKATVYPDGSDRVAISLSEVLFFRNLSQKFSALGPLLKYVYRDAFWENHFGSHIRHLIGNLRSAAGEFDPSKPEHLALICDIAAVFSIALAQCAAEVFRQYLQPSSKDTLSELLKMLVWGGREQFDFYEALRKKIFDVKAGEQIIEPLGLPEWNHFVQLVRNLLERPSSAFDLPWILRRFAMDLAKGWEPLKYARHNDLLTVKFGMLTISYLCKACQLPSEFEKDLTSKLVSVQTRIVERRDNPSEKRGESHTTSENKIHEQPVQSSAAGTAGLTLFPPNDVGEKK